MERPTGQLEAKTRRSRGGISPRDFESPRIAAVGGGIGALDSASLLEGGETEQVCV